MNMGREEGEEDPEEDEEKKDEEWREEGRHNFENRNFVTFWAQAEVILPFGKIQTKSRPEV